MNKNAIIEEVTKNTFYESNFGILEDVTEFIDKTGEFPAHVSVSKTSSIVLYYADRYITFSGYGGFVVSKQFSVIHIEEYLNSH